MDQIELERKLEEHLAEMLDWAEGRRSWTNYGPHEPYTPDVIARMDAAEVEKHAAAIHGLAAALEDDRAHRLANEEANRRWAARAAREAT